MKHVFLIVLAVVCLAFRPVASTYQIQPATSQLTWTGYAEVGTWAPSGTLKLHSGTFEYAGNALRQARLEFDMTSVAHADAKLQEHLRSADFFDVQRFPTAVFVLRSVSQGQASGLLTVKGITRPVRFPMAVVAQADGLHVQGTALIDRTQFGVNYNSSSFFQNLGSYAVRNEFQLKFDVVGVPVSMNK
ncbi:YceI family protein [Hymenobacter sp. BT491]|uniref:YceI family protein n=1 Tax=Hymenobacter sp. BT491 TaxID=2766779 RepID=UPI0016535DEB|nr:YceI family protein [Hymenobacter sp. BT491]MBC6990389.1 YceI family protein [Hymenobacter sp. BT491]